MGGGGPIPPKGWTVKVPGEWLLRVAEWLEQAAKTIRDLLESDKKYNPENPEYKG